MKKKSKINYQMIGKLSVVLLFIICSILVVSRNFNIKSTLTFDISKNRSMKGIHLVSKYVPSESKIKPVKNMDEILMYALKYPVTFNNIMDGYGTDQMSSPAVTACPPKLNVSKSVFKYKDTEYGNVRILATNDQIPCGTMIKISNIPGHQEFYAIVLDRDNSIKDTKFKLLFATEKEAINFGKLNVTYTIVRWGW